MNDTVTPTRARQRVRFIGYGGKVRQWMAEVDGTVLRITAEGNPVIRLDNSPTKVAHRGSDTLIITDTYGCARVIDAEGKLIRYSEGETT